MKRFNVGVLLLVLGSLPFAVGGRVLGQEAVGEFPARLAAAVGSGFVVEVGIPLMDAGLAEYRDVAAVSDRLRIRAESVRPGASGRFMARGVRVEGDGLSSPMTAESLQADLAVVERVLTSGDDVVGGVCDEDVSRQPLRLRVTDFAAGPNAQGESVSVSELLVELAAVWENRSQVCRISAKFDLTGFVRIGAGGSRLDVRGLTLTVNDALQSDLAEVVMNVAEARVTTGAGSEEAALGTGNARMSIDRMWVGELVEGLLLQGSLPPLPDFLGYAATGGEAAEMRAVSVDADLVFGKNAARLYRLATGRRSVNFSARVTGEREETGDYRVRLHLFGPDMLDAVFFARVRTGRKLEVVAADILYRDLGFAGLLDRMEAGAVVSLLQHRLGELASGTMSTAAVEALVLALGGAGPWLERAREERMQASFRPREVVTGEVLAEVLARGQAKVSAFLGLRHGPYAAR